MLAPPASSSLGGASSEHQSESAYSSSQSCPQPHRSAPELDPFASLSNSLPSSAILSHSPPISSAAEHPHPKRHFAIQNALSRQNNEEGASQPFNNRNAAQLSAEALGSDKGLRFGCAPEAGNESGADDRLDVDSELEADEELESEDEETFEQQLASGAVEAEAKRLKEVIGLALMATCQREALRRF